MSTTQPAAPAHDRIKPDAGSMHAVIQDRYGPAEVLHHAMVARPATGENDVLIRVRAAGRSRTSAATHIGTT